MTLFQELNGKLKNYKNYKGSFGLEIETEGLQPYMVPEMAFWAIHKDDSLRGPAPYEYVSKVPLSFEEVKDALHEFKDKTKEVKFDEGSFTTSVHTHVNMLNETFTTFGNFLTTYALTENLLKKFAGPTRESNLFCLPLCDAEENFHTILGILKCIEKSQWGGIQVDPQEVKYAALNMSALHKYGSLEIRLLRGTTDPTLIQNWVGLLDSILQYSRQDMTPREFINTWREKGVEVLKDIFGPYRHLLKTPDEEKLIEQNFWYAANIAVGVKNWKALDEKKPPKKLNSKHLDTIAIKNYGVPFNNLPEDIKVQIIVNYEFVDMNLVGNVPMPVMKKPKKLGLQGAAQPWIDEPVPVEENENF